MTYRHALTAVLAMALMVGGATLLALERATFVLTDGQRVSGQVVFHTEAHTNIRADKNEFNVLKDDNNEMAIPFAQVVLIDFAGGRPTNAELQALPSSGHLLALRNGEFRRGRLIDMINGDTVRWEQAVGGQQDFPISQVRRVYLQPDRAREMYNYSADTAGGGGFGRGGRFGRNRGVNGSTVDTSAMTTIRTVTVRGTDAFIDTAVTVRAGDMLAFDTSGRVFFARDPGMAATAAGSDREHNPQFPVPDLGAGALIGKVGNSAPFAIGDGKTPVRMPASGRLMLGINDTIMDDNSGSFRVGIKR
jgi:hypothetical protein